MKYLLHTNVISELVAREPNPTAVTWINQTKPGAVYPRVIAVGEIRKGIERLAPSARRDARAEWLKADLLVGFEGRIAEISAEMMLMWGELVGRLEREGKPLGAISSLIAATALQGGSALATRNEQDFLNTGVTVVNPWQS